MAESMSQGSLPGARAWRAGLLLALGACGGGANAAGTSTKVSPLTGAVCDPNLSYAHDIVPFMRDYCVNCHSENLRASSRVGAPAGVNFDNEQEILAQAMLVDAEAGAGPLMESDVMPPPVEGYPPPRTAERETLSRWLACSL